jgi:hypothetical protein
MTPLAALLRDIGVGPLVSDFASTWVLFTVALGLSALLSACEPKGTTLIDFPCRQNQTMKCTSTTSPTHYRQLRSMTCEELGLSPAVSTGTTSTGITGTQGPRR